MCLSTCKYGKQLHNGTFSAARALLGRFLFTSVCVHVVLAISLPFTLDILTGSWRLRADGSPSLETAVTVTKPPERATKESRLFDRVEPANDTPVDCEPVLYEIPEKESSYDSVFEMEYVAVEAEAPERFIMRPGVRMPTPPAEDVLGDKDREAVAVRQPEVPQEVLYEPKGETKKALLVERPIPEYPEFSRIRGQEGIVRIRIEVGVKGDIAGSEIAESSGYERLDRAAIKAAAIAVFKPALENGVPVRSFVVIPFRFELE